MEELIERLEKADGPNLALEWEIHLTVRGIEGAGMYGAHPNYTASIDAALRLMPELTDMLRPIEIAIKTSESGKKHAATITNWKWGTVHGGPVATPALALCIAALKARAIANASSD